MSLLLRWLLNAAALFGIAYLAPQLGILPGFHVDFSSALVAVLVLSLLNMTIRPILKLLTLPLTCLTFGLFSLVINALMMWGTAQVVTGFAVGSFWNAIVLSILYAIAGALLNGLFNQEDE